VYAALKAFHLVFMVAWFAGLFYLPRLYVYHAMSSDETGIERFKIMERKLYFGIMLPAATLTVISGGGLALFHGFTWIQATEWFHWKLGMITILIAYHFYLGYLRRAFDRNANAHSHVFYRWINEIPVVILVVVVILAVVKPQ
jgi:protoporphyrinogen IX oxidase